MVKLIIILSLLLPVNALAQEINDDLLKEQRNVESENSHYRNDGTIQTSLAGALGIAQFMPDTWDWMIRTKKIPSHYSIYDEKHQLIAQEVYMKWLYSYDYGIDDSSTVLALASYNAGINKVRRLVKEFGYKWRDHLPDETKDYLVKLNL